VDRRLAVTRTCTDDRCQRADYESLILQRAVGDDRAGVSASARGWSSPSTSSQGPESHQHHERGDARQGDPIEVRVNPRNSCPPTTRSRSCIEVRYGDARRPVPRLRPRQPGTSSNAIPGQPQRLSFFGLHVEHRGISTLKPDHEYGPDRASETELVDLFPGCSSAQTGLWPTKIRSARGGTCSSSSG